MSEFRYDVEYAAGIDIYGEPGIKRIWSVAAKYDLELREKGQKLAEKREQITRAFESDGKPEWLDAKERVENDLMKVGRLVEACHVIMKYCETGQLM